MKKVESCPQIINIVIKLLTSSSDFRVAITIAVSCFLSFYLFS